MTSATPFLVPVPKDVSFSETFLTLPPKVEDDCKNGFDFENPVLVKQLETLAGAPADWLAITCKEGTVKTPLNPEQAYELIVTSDGVTIRANTELGLLYALQTFRQLKATSRTYRCATIRDWPDLAFRICARPMLCAEAGRSALEWGDGRKAELARWKHEIDFALQAKYNGIFIHGMTWSTDCSPDYAKEMRMLNTYARHRGVHLIFSGYGIGRGGWGNSNYLGEAHDFVPGLGHSVEQTYPCSQNNPKDPRTAYNGTCRSNPEIRKAKVRELVEFLKAIEPGAIYVHHEDHSRFKAESEDNFWLKRCPQCRKKWPSDHLEDIDGGAAAIADSYDVLGEACSLAKKRSGYDAARDCFIMPVSPAYGECNCDDETWRKNETLWLNVCSLMKHQDNVFIGLREQFADCDGEARLKRLARRITEQGGKQRLFVFFVSGAALYGENVPFSSLPELNGIVSDGHGGIFDFSGVVFQRPQQLFNSECSWNALHVPNGETLPDDAVQDWLGFYRNRMQSFDFISPRHRFLNGWLAKACSFLYGKKAGDAIFKYQLLQTPHGDGPLTVLYQQTSMEKLFNKLTMPENPFAYPNFLTRPVKTYLDTAERWQEQADLTRQAQSLIATARKSVAGWLGEELERQHAQLALGAEYAELVAALYRRNAGEDITQSALMAQWQKVKDIMEALPSDFASPNEGDGPLYQTYLQKLQDFIKSKP